MDDSDYHDSGGSSGHDQRLKDPEMVLIECVLRGAVHEIALRDI